MCWEVVFEVPGPAGFEGVLVLQLSSEDEAERVRGLKSPPRPGRGAKSGEESSHGVDEWPDHCDHKGQS